ncbi:MAG: hypothetical protein Q9187_007584, partial [Circinaria calcarea]
TRAEAGKSSAFRDERQGKTIDDKKLRRHLKQNMRQDVAIKRTSDEGARELRILSGSSFLLSNSMYVVMVLPLLSSNSHQLRLNLPSFLNWNMPYGTMHSARARGPSYTTASPISTSTPSDIVVDTPPNNNALSPNNAPSPLTRVQNRKEAMDRAHMFVEGRHGALVKSLRREEKEMISTWLYQFWFYSFKTAKCWGYGPRNWDTKSLRLDAFKALSPTPLASSPRADGGSVYDQPTRPNLQKASESNVVDTIPKPSPLCRWSIHYDSGIEYEPCRSRTPTPEPEPDPLNEESWRPWPDSWKELPFQKRLLNNLESNDFSNIKPETLPISVPQIIKALEKSDDQLLEEAFGFSIIARNLELFHELYDKLPLTSQNGHTEAMEKIRELNPLHLATTYLDGSKACCTIVDTLLNTEWELNFRASNVNSLGHTVFDNLLIAILKAHTSITPGAIDDALRDEKRFPGEEVDICGRWDADSDCVQALYSAGTPCIPLTWKHKFCHTSAQTVSHCIEIFCEYSMVVEDATILDVPSGLFLKHCRSCGLKLQLGSLHSTVLTAFGLAQYGAKDEDLFGMLAVLLAMLRNGADSSYRVDVSVSALFEEVESDWSNGTECDHEKLSPAELAKRVPLCVIERWPRDTRVGWEIFCCTLQRSEQQWKINELPIELSEVICNSNDEYHCGNFFGIDRSLAVLCGAVQVEILTYRRLRDGDRWVSLNFDMCALRDNFLKGGHVSVGLVEKDMMNEVCDCGGFKVLWPSCPRAEEVTSYYFSNLEDWSRSTFIQPTGRCLL